MASERERTTQVQVPGYENIESGDIHDFLAPLYEHASLSDELHQSEILFKNYEGDKLFNLICEVEGRDRGCAMYVAALSAIRYYGNRGIPCTTRVYVLAQSRKIGIGGIGFLPDFPDSVNSRRRAQLVRRAQETLEDFQDMLCQWGDSPIDRVTAFELPSYTSKPLAYVN